MWKAIPILACLSLVVCSFIEEHDEGQTPMESDPDVSSTEILQDSTDTSCEISLFSKLPLEMKGRVFGLLDYRDFTWCRVINRECLAATKYSIPFNAVKEILLRDQCPKSDELIRVLLLLVAQPGPYPILTEIFSTTESKPIVILYDRIQSLPIPSRLRDLMSDKLVDVINNDKVRQMFAGLRRHSQWARTGPKLDADFARSSQDKLRDRLPDGLLDPFYHVQEINSDCSVEDRFVEMDVAHLLLSEEVLELLAFCGIRIPLWKLMTRIPDISAEQLEAIFPFLSDSLYMNNDQGTGLPDCLSHHLCKAAFNVAAASLVFHLPPVADYYRAHLDSLTKLSHRDLKVMIDLNVPFLRDLFQHRFALTGDTLMHVLCKQEGGINAIRLLASQYGPDDCNLFTETNANGFVPFYYLQWSVVKLFISHWMPLFGRLLSSAPNAFFVRRLDPILRIVPGCMGRFNWRDLLLRELSPSVRGSVAELFDISSIYYQQYCRLKDSIWSDQPERLYHTFLDTIRSQTNAELRSALLILLSKDHLYKDIANSVTSDNIEYQQVLAQVKERQRILEFATQDELRVLLVTEAAHIITRPDPITHITALHNAFYHGEFDLVMMALFVDGVDIGARDSAGTVPFQYATDGLMWRLVRDLPKTVMASLVRSHPYTFLLAAYRSLMDTTHRYLYLLFENLHLFEVCVSASATCFGLLKTGPFD